MKMNIKNIPLPSLQAISLSAPMLILYFFFLVLGASFAYYPLGVLGGTLLFFLFIAFFAKPLLGLLLIVVFMPVKTIVFMVKSPIRDTPDLIHFYFIPVFIVFCLYAIFFLSRAHKDYPKNPIAGLAAAIFGWAVITLFWTEDVNHGLNSILSIVECVLVVPLFGYFLKDKESLDKVLIFSLFVGLTLAALTTLSYWYYPREKVELFQDVNFVYGLNKEQDRPAGLGPANHNANVLAFFIMIGIALFYRLRSRWARGLIVAVCLFMIFNIFFSGSKGAVGSLVLGLLFLIFTVRSLRKNWVWWVVAIGACGFLSMIFTGLATGEDFFKQRTIASASISSISLSTRIEFWRIGLEYIWDSYGFGTGIGGYARLVDPWPAAHSIYFSGLFDLGVIGFLLIAWLAIRLMIFVFRFFRTCKDDEVRFTAKCLVAYLVVFSIHGFVDFDYIYFPAWMAVSLLIATLHIGSASPGPAVIAQPDAQSPGSSFRLALPPAV
jgi:O-antigen ligase